MSKLLWRIKFIRLMNRKRRGFFTVKDLWEFSEFWFNKGETPENSVRMFYGNDIIKGQQHDK